MICAEGEKSCPPSNHVPVTPAEKGVDHSTSDCLSPVPLLSISQSDERRTMNASTTKGRTACVWMRRSFLLSCLLLLLLDLSLRTPSDLLTHFVLPSPASCSISGCLTPLSVVAPPFFVRALAIQSGDGIKNQKVSLSKRHPGWRTLMSPREFEIHMLSHFILYPPSPALSHSFSLCFFILFSVKCHHVLFT